MKLPIRSPFLINVGEEVWVQVPSAEDILGDKLTAFAPHTTGIPFFKGRTPSYLEVVKQMYDISTLADIVTDLYQVASTFNKFVNVELGYREYKEITQGDVLDDAIDTAMTITLKGTKDPEEYKWLQSGIQRLDNLVIPEKYTLELAIRDAAKAAYVATLVKQGRADFQKYQYETVLQLPGMKVLNTKLNKLRKTNPEAFFYWAMIDAILNERG